MKTTAIVVAAGRGTRMGGETPKQYQMLAGRSVLERTLAALVESTVIDDIVLVVADQDRPRLAGLDARLMAALRVVSGGATRGASVRAGLAAIADDDGYVLIHDAARPLVSARLIAAVRAALADCDGAAPGLALADALWRGDARARVGAILPRDDLFRAQTPQGFRLRALRRAYADDDGAAADDVAVARAAGIDVAIVAGEDSNLKLTYPGDFARAEQILGERRMDRAIDLRTGNGFDVHKFCPGDRVTLCGVTLPFERALSGHSDADVGMHALTDAIYGALAEGDIGQHFPPSDPQWKGADSRIFLEHAMERVRARGYRLGNGDVTLICEAPKIGPHQDAMRSALAGIMGVEAARISVKATTSEQLGFTGRGEGIAALASVSLIAQG